MVRIKRGVAILLTIALTLALTCSFASANTDASDYLTEYGAALIATETKGQYDLYFDMMATQTSDMLGVSVIKMYKGDGTYLYTLTGSVSNGLIIKNDCVHMGVFPRTGESGESYYAEVTFFARRGTGSDSRTITTNTVTVK